MRYCNFCSSPVFPYILQAPVQKRLSRFSLSVFQNLLGMGGMHNAWVYCKKLNRLARDVVDWTSLAVKAESR